MKHRLLTVTAVTLTMLSAACHSDEPKTIEDVRPNGPVCFPRKQPDSRGLPNGSDAATQPAPAPAAASTPATLPTSVPTTMTSAHGMPGHWCALCAAAAARGGAGARARVADHAGVGPDERPAAAMRARRRLL